MATRGAGCGYRAAFLSSTYLGHPYLCGLRHLANLGISGPLVFSSTLDKDRYGRGWSGGGDVDV